MSKLLCMFSEQWESMEEYSCMIPRDTYDGAFYRAVLALHMDQFTLAQQVSMIIGMFLREIKNIPVLNITLTFHYMKIHDNL